MSTKSQLIAAPTVESSSPRTIPITDELWIEACLFLARKDLCQLRLLCHHFAALLADGKAHQPCKQLHWIDEMIISEDNIEIDNYYFTNRSCRQQLLKFSTGEASWPLAVDYVRFNQILILSNGAEEGMRFLRNNTAAVSTVIRVELSAVLYTKWTPEIWREFFSLFGTSREIYLRAESKSFEQDEAAISEVLRYAVDWLGNGLLVPGSFGERDRYADFYANGKLGWVFPPRLKHLMFMDSQCNRIIGMFLNMLQERFIASTERLPYTYNVDISNYHGPRVGEDVCVENTTIAEVLLVGHEFVDRDNEQRYFILRHPRETIEQLLGSAACDDEAEANG